MEYENTKEQNYDLSSNINFVKPKINIDLNSLDISSYPSYDKLYKKIAQIYNISPLQLEFFSGVSSATFSLLKYLDLKYCTIYSPSNLEYKKACVSFGYQIYTVNRFENIYSNIKEKSLVIFTNPSNPDGKYYDLEKLLNLWQEKDCTILIDESFLDFCDGKSAIKYLKEYDKLYILKSMMEFYSSTGVRIGAIISNKKNIENIKKFEPMFKISQFDSSYLQACLEDKNFKLISKAINLKNKIQLENILKSCPIFEKVFPSDTNFFLVKLNKLNAKQFQEKLRPFNILIKDCSNFDFLDDSFICICVKSAYINKRLEEVLKELC